MRFAGTAQPEQARALVMLPHCVGGVGVFGTGSEGWNCERSFAPRMSGPGLGCV